MQTEIYFIRHAEPNYNNHDDLTRELTKKGLVDRELVTNYLSDKNIEIVLSSPYKRAIDTVKHFADKYNMIIENMDILPQRQRFKKIELLIVQMHVTQRTNHLLQPIKLL